MFRFHKTKDVVTLFHKASVPSSVKVHSLLKQLSAAASGHATEDQASDHTAQNKSAPRSEFELDVTEEPPTEDQLRSIISYLGASGPGQAIKGAKDEADALRKLKTSGDSFERPFTVDWSNGKAVAGANESEILKMIEALPKSN